jgi:type VI secretion system protein ImpH
VATPQGAEVAAVTRLPEVSLPGMEPLVAALLARAPQMNFMQLCRILELHRPDRPGFGTRDTPEQEPVRFRSHERTGFPASEIASVGIDDELAEVWPDAPPSVRTTFMGLYGVDAAIPSHLVDDIVLRTEGHEAVERFLDLFHHRQVTVLYRIWKKYRYPVGFTAGGADAHSRRLLCLAGFGWGDKPARAGLPDSRLLALLGLLVQRTRTAEGLAGVIALAAPGVTARVDEFWPTWVPAGQQRALGTATPAAGAPGRKSGLGSSYVLGRRIVNRSRAVRVTLRPADAHQARGLLPGEPLHRELIAFLTLYIGTKADVLLFMDLSSADVPAPRIGGGADYIAPRLTWTTVLPCAQPRRITIALGRYEAFPVPAPNPYLTSPSA